MKPVNQVGELLHCGPSRDVEVPFKNELPCRQSAEQAANLGSVSPFWRSQRFLQFIKFCMVGGSGLFVDMGILYLLADPRSLGLNLTLSKICAAEIAMINNFVWNEFWTFRQVPSPVGRERVRARGGLFRRFMIFNAFCGIGLVLAVVLLHVFHTLIGWNLYLSNFLAITLVTFWNFGMNARFNWPSEKSFHLRRGGRI